jgi:hypothetical protein
MKDQPSRRRSLALLATMVLGACTSGSSTSGSSTAPSGTQALAPGQAIQVWVGRTYRTINVCNDTTSKGAVTVTIDARGSDVLEPGLCTENTGSSINLVNDRGGPALIVYRSEIPGFLRD